MGGGKSKGGFLVSGGGLLLFEYASTDRDPISIGRLRSQLGEQEGSSCFPGGEKRREGYLLTKTLEGVKAYFG